MEIRPKKIITRDFDEINAIMLEGTLNDAISVLTRIRKKIQDNDGTNAMIYYHESPVCGNYYSIQANFLENDEEYKENLEREAEMELAHQEEMKRIEMGVNAQKDAEFKKYLELKAKYEGI